MTPLQRAPRPSRHSEAGAVILEFALIAPLFLLMLWGIISYGALFGLSQSIANAASEAARSALTVDVANAETTAESVALANLDWLGPTQTPTITTSVDPCSYDAALTCLTIEVSYPWQANPIVPSPLPAALVPDQVASTAVVQLQS